MNNFAKGILLGVGVGLLIAPMSGEETRRALNERFTNLRNSLPENSQITVYVRNLSDRVSQTSDNLRDYAQQAVSTMKDTGSALGDLAQRSAHEVKQTGQDVAQQTKDAVQSGKSSTTRVISDSPNGTL